MRSRLLSAAPLALLASVAACSGLDALRSGRLDVQPATLEEAGRSDDPSLDDPLLAILALRIDGGFTAMDDRRVVAAIHALERRGTTTAVPALEALAFDPVLEVQRTALVALETLGGESSLPAVADAAKTLSRPAAREQAYHTFSTLAGTRVHHLDERALDRVLAARGHSVRSR